jgi:transportin-1
LPLKIREVLSKFWLSLIQKNQSIFFTLLNQIFSFFKNNLMSDQYDIQFTSCEFFYKLIDAEDECEYHKNEEICGILKISLNDILPYFLHFTKLTPLDLCYSELENKQFNDNLQHSPSESMQHQDFNEDNMEMYNPNWTLRKCSSKILDRLSNLFPLQVINTLIPFLENDLKSKEWAIKERSILCLGAVGKGSYAYLKATLQPLIKFLIGELSNSNKLVRAISCWTLSRFTEYVLFENRNQEAGQLRKLYLQTLLKAFLDEETIVQEASMTAFIAAVNSKPEQVAPYLSEVLQVVNTVLFKFTGNSLLTLYEIIINLCENFECQFKNSSVIEEVIVNLLRKWYEIVTKSDLDLNSDNYVIGIFDVISSITKVSGFLMRNYFSDILNFTVSLIDKHFENEEMITKSLDILSALCLSLPDMLREDQDRSKIIESIIKIYNSYQNSSYVKQYLFPMIGDICRADTSLLGSHLDFFVNILVNHIQLPEGKIKPDLETISICNNSCWTIGLISLCHKEALEHKIEEIITKIINLLNRPKMNKSLAQNICVCIGRLGLAFPHLLGKHLDVYVKQFCLTIKQVNNSLEKQQAFEGLCQIIIQNPTGVLNHFAFLCDSICHYEDAPFSLESLFHNIILSFINLLQDQWSNYVSLFPEKLKNKLYYRFSLYSS